MKNERKHISQPPDWWQAFERKASLEGVSLSEWLGERGKSGLAKTVAAKLSERPPAHRPKKD